MTSEPAYKRKKSESESESESESDCEEDVPGRALDWIQDDSTVLLLGRRGSGKSVLIKEICFHMRHIPLVMVISPTKVNGFYDTWVPQSCIYEKFSEKLLADLIERQKRIKQSNKTLDRMSQVNPKCMLILDDCIGEKEAQSSASLRTLFVNGRHLDVLVIMASQHITSHAIPPLIRNNSDVVFCWAQSSFDAIQVVVKQWLSGCTETTDEDAMAELSRATKNVKHRAFVINCKKAGYSTSLYQFTTTYLATQELPRFRVGSAIYWEGKSYLANPPARSAWARLVTFCNEGVSEGYEQPVANPPARHARE
jgi:hypothetical protein